MKKIVRLDETKLRKVVRNMIAEMKIPDQNSTSNYKIVNRDGIINLLVDHMIGDADYDDDSYLQKREDLYNSIRGRFSIDQMLDQLKTHNLIDDALRMEYIY